MLSLIFIVLLAIFLFLAFVGDECLAFCVGIVMFGVFVFYICEIDTVVAGKNVDEKIQMYTEENTKIEEQINATVERYMEYEGDTFKELKGDSGVTLVSLYPELKSDELIKLQIETYTSNNKKIKELKEQQIDVKAAKWWLYFGK